MKLFKLSIVVLGSLAAMASWVAFAVFVGFYGGWMKPMASVDDHASFFAEATREIETSNLGNTAFILIEGGDIVGEFYAKSEHLIDEDTVFQTASFSKWITALGIMSLVEDGHLDLDDPVAGYLTRWQLPLGSYNEDDVTIRRLLSHKAGLTDGLGFGDYVADETLPTIEETLAKPRASAGRDVAITVGAEPGEEFAYSGGGYAILQLVIEEVTGQAFEEFISATILEPLEMRRSSFDFIGGIDGATASFDANGAPAPQFQYAVAGATGFASSVGDLTKLVKATIGDHNALGLQSETLQSMRQPEAFVFGAGIWGLGTMLYAPTRSGNDFVFGHDGANEPAINVAVRVNPETNSAFIMMVNGHPSLASDLGAEWVLWQTGNPDFLSTERVLKSAVLPAIAGSFPILAIVLLLVRRSSRRAK